MLDIQFIRNHPDLVQRTAEQKRITLSVTDLLYWDQQRRDLLK